MPRIANNGDERVERVWLFEDTDNPMWVDIRKTSVTVEAGREVQRHYRDIEIRAKRMEQLERELIAEPGAFDYKERLTELEALRTRPDYTDLLVEFLIGTTADWEYYRTEEDKLQDRRIPVTREEILTLDSVEISLITEALSKKLTIQRNESEEKKSSASSPPSLQVVAPSVMN